MAKVKLTKTALKQQRDSLKQFRRFLPTLQLKKQQLQMEMLSCQERIKANEASEQKSKDALASWLRLFGDSATLERVTACVSTDRIHTDLLNIAGVDVPVFKGITFSQKEYSLFQEDPWVDDAVAAVKKIVEIQAEREIIREQYRLIANELKVTTQRVNLFEKVKIPECRDNIRLIQIYLGDMDTSAVCRSKIAKKKLQEVSVI